MIPKKYTDLGFELARIGVNSKILKFCQKPIFVFSSSASISVEFLAHICEMYLKVCENGKGPEPFPKNVL